MLAEGLAESRSAAQALILSGVVLVDDTPVDKAGARVADSAQVRLKRSVRAFVSRGGEKLAGALMDLGFDPSGLRCLDVGASTGGFTDCLLQRGAGHVVAVDVGQGQLHSKLLDDPRVSAHDKINARYLERALLGGDIDLVVVDVSFISVRLILPRIAEVTPDAQLLVMVKPQFEVGRGQVGKGGVVRAEALREQSAADVVACAEGLGYALRGQADSRVPGPRGNREIFVWLAPAVESGRK